MTLDHGQNERMEENKDIEAPDDVLRSVMAQCSKWVEGEKHVTITINIHNNILGDIENLYNNLVE